MYWPDPWSNLKHDSVIPDPRPDSYLKSNFVKTVQ